MIPNTVFWIEEADNMHGVHKGRAALEEGAEVEGPRCFVSGFSREFPRQSADAGVTDGFW